MTASSWRPDAEARDVSAVRFRALADIARIPAVHSGDDTLRRITRAALTALDGASASLSRWEPEHGRVCTVVNEGQLGPEEVPDPVDECYSIHEYQGLFVLLQDMGCLVATVDDDDGGQGYVRTLRQLRKGSCVAAPIPLDGRVWGELFVTRTLDQPPFTDADALFAMAVAAQVGAAMATTEHVSRIERMALTDGLTGVANRRAFDDQLDQVFHRRASDPDLVLSLIVCDLNGLKRLNDDQGHDAGDRALVRFASLLSAAAARLPGALAARLGGDEFCIVVDGPSADAVVDVAVDLCRQVQRSPLEGVACGVASTGDDVGVIDSPGRLLRLADAAQYRAKRSRSVLPVVAGRTLPAEAVVRLGAHPHDRRTVRGRDVTESGRMLELGVIALEDAHDGDAVHRLALIGDLICHHVDGLGWWLSRRDPDGDQVETLQYAAYRSTGVMSAEDDGSNRVGAVFRLEEYPLTAAAVRGGAVCIEATDPAAPASEVALLDGMGAVSLLMAGATDRHGVGWLMEMFGDEMSHSLRELLPAARALVVMAVNEGRH